ncbi:MAG: Gfo/Idh/MocA family protein [Planctomycetota bacterium]
MTRHLTRRHFLALTSAATAGLAVSCQMPGYLLPGTKLRHAQVGCGGMGAADLGQISQHPDVEVTALCDVDANNLKKAAEAHPTARTYSDWRTMFKAEKGMIDSVCVSTPDHMHAPVSMTALWYGLHVYCQKPLTHTVMEARTLARMARRKKVVTQMGIQNHSGQNYLRALELFRSGFTGRASQVHVWTDRPAGWWPQNVARPEGSDPVPAHLNWDAWLGVAKDRPYKDGAYHAFVWRGRKEFGTGAQGDMACHLMDPALWFLGLRDPLTVRSDGPKPPADSFPDWSRVSYRFPATDRTVAEGVDVTWHDGGRKPDDLIERYGITDVYANACLFVCTEGAFLVSPYEPCRFFNKDGKEETLELPDTTGVNHWHQWVDACYGRIEATTPFDYSSLLTEVALLGNVALEYPGQQLGWNASTMHFAARPDADKLLHKNYRAGWEVRGL